MFWDMVHIYEAKVLPENKVSFLCSFRLMEIMDKTINVARIGGEG